MPKGMEKSKKKMEESDDASLSDESSEDEEDMKKNLENLEKQDPEFYKYLKENDNQLLDFEGVNPLEAMSDDDDEEQDDEEEAEIEDKGDVAPLTSKAPNKVEITTSLSKNGASNWKSLLRKLSETSSLRSKPP